MCFVVSGVDIALIRSLAKVERRERLLTGFLTAKWLRFSIPPPSMLLRGELLWQIFYQRVCSGCFRVVWSSNLDGVLVNICFPALQQVGKVWSCLVRELPEHRPGT